MLEITPPIFLARLYPVLVYIPFIPETWLLDPSFTIVQEAIFG
jgi:hypothetical protein